MKWAEISIRTTHEATEIIAEIFHDLGATGVVIEDPELVNTYRNSGDWDYTDIPEALDTETVTVKAYLPADEELDDKLRCFEARVDALAAHDIDKGCGDISLQEIQDEDWATSWKAFFHPTRIGERIVIKPTWEAYEKALDDIVIELDPGMAFGTGTHHTTAMCLRLLEELVQAGMTVFDVGTGSGVLAVAAAKLGAARVTAVDFDSVAVRTAQENVAQNGEAARVTVGRSDLLRAVSGQADLIVANIIADVVIRLFDEAKEKLRPGGKLLVSGIIADRLPDVTEAALQRGLTVDRVVEEGDWAAMLLLPGGGE